MPILPTASGEISFAAYLTGMYMTDDITAYDIILRAYGSFLGTNYARMTDAKVITENAHISAIALLIVSPHIMTGDTIMNAESTVLSANTPSKTVCLLLFILSLLIFRVSTGI